MKNWKWMQRVKSKNSKNVFEVLGTFALIAGFCLMTALPASASASDAVEYHDVIINGYTLGFFEQWVLEDHINRKIADGNYWFELDTGLWGPIGGPAIGHIDIPEDYQEYVESRLKPDQAAQVEYSAPAENCHTGCVYW